MERKILDGAKVNECKIQIKHSYTDINNKCLYAGVYKSEISLWHTWRVLKKQQHFKPSTDKPF